MTKEVDIVEIGHISHFSLKQWQWLMVEADEADFG